MWKQKCASHCLLIGLVFIFSSCRSENDRAALQSSSNDLITSSTPPFQTKEPERYQAVRTITFNAAGREPVVTSYRIARNGSMRREENEAGETEESCIWIFRTDNSSSCRKKKYMPNSQMISEPLHPLNHWRVQRNVSFISSRLIPDIKSLGLNH